MLKEGEYVVMLTLKNEDDEPTHTDLGYTCHSCAADAIKIAVDSLPVGTKFAFTITGVKGPEETHQPASEVASQQLIDIVPPSKKDIH